MFEHLIIDQNRCRGPFVAAWQSEGGTLRQPRLAQTAAIQLSKRASSLMNIEKAQESSRALKRP